MTDVTATLAVETEAAATNANAEARPKLQLAAVNETAADHFIHRDGVTFAGSHLILDLWEAEGLTDQARIERAFREAVEAAKATLLHIHLHVFEPGGGISGVAVLAESHISIHTWPERGYAALDIFMCGDAEPLKAAEILQAAFKPGRAELNDYKRGVVAKD
ncbi:MAG: adenosylmethionine decarboxylase [Alphaproteobacteria bacterium]